MGVILEIREGPTAGKKVAVATGQTVTFGRAVGRAQFVLPHDTFMSGVHFAVKCGPSGCFVQDRKSSNGTFLNGSRIQDAMLANGDEIKGGQTIFAVKIVSDAKLASLIVPEEVAQVSASPPPHAADPVPLSVPEQPPPAGAASPGQQWPRAFEPALAAPPESQPLAEAAPPAILPAARLVEEPKPAPPASPPMVRPPASAGAPIVEPELSSPAARRFSGAQEPPAAADLPLRPEAPVRSPLPPVEEPPKFHAIPTPPGVGAKPPHAGENPPRVGEVPRGGEDPPEADRNPANSRANPLRSGEPPAGVAPYIAQKFRERPASRDAGIPRGTGFSVMGWSFPAAPAEWQVQDGFGLQQSGHEEFPSSVAATEELLGGITLQQFVESQISTLRGYLRDPKIEPTMPPRVGGADESMAVDVRHSTKDGRDLVYRRIYARSGSSVGVLTVTTLAADFPQVLETLQPLLDGAAFRATVNN
jgi:pSer/pThr/pTyr-binding forkhead associated (FHA) protein